MRRDVWTVCLAGVVLAWSGTAWAGATWSDERPACEPPVESGPRADQPQALIGPAVRETKTDGVSTGFDGRLRRGEGRPEETIARGLELDAETADRLDALMAVRIAALDRFIAGNVRMLNELNSASSAGDVPATLLLVLRGLVILESLGWQRDLQGAVRQALPESRRGEYDEAMKIYWDAVAADKAERGSDGRSKGRWAAILEEKLELLGGEIAARFESMERSGELAYAYLTDGLGLTPDQEVRVREIVDEYARETGGQEATQKQQERFFFKVLAELTAEQQATMIRRVRGR